MPQIITKQEVIVGGEKSKRPGSKWWKASLLDLVTGKVEQVFCPLEVLTSKPVELSLELLQTLSGKSDLVDVRYTREGRIGSVEVLEKTEK